MEKMIDITENTTTESNNFTEDKLNNYVLVLNGSGKLVQFGLVHDKNLINPESTINPVFLYKNISPQNQTSNIYIREYSDFKHSDIPNYINGNLIILSTNVSASGTFSSLANHSQDAQDVLNNLYGINGSLYIVGTEYNGISGFNKLEYITGNLVIVNNSKLGFIPSFQKLTSVGTSNEGKIIISNNAQLKKIVGFEKLKQVTDGIYIMDNNSLHNICGFMNISILNNFVVCGNSFLTEIEGFCYLRLIKNKFYLTKNNTKTNIESNLKLNCFKNLATVGKLFIKENDNLRDLTFVKLLKINNKICIENNNLLKNINFPELIFSGNLIIRDNADLTDIDFPKLHQIEKNLILCNNTELFKIDTFNDLKCVNGSILFIENPSLKTIKGFDTLESIGSQTFLVHNEIIENSNDFQTDWFVIEEKINETNGEITDPIIVYDFCKPFLLPTNFCKDISSVNYTNYFGNNLEQLGKLEKLSNYNASIIIYNNPKLINIESFNFLENIGSSIYITQNISLDAVVCFEKLQFLLDIYIRNNPSIKIIKGLADIIRARDIVITETIQLELFSGLKKLKNAQHIYLQSKYKDSIPAHNLTIRSVVGLLLHH